MYFCGSKILEDRGELYLSYRYNDIISGFSLFIFHTPLLLKVGSLYDSLVRAYNCKYAWYVASGLTGIMIYILVFHFFFSYTLASKSGITI